MELPHMGDLPMLMYWRMNSSASCSTCASLSVEARTLAINPELATKGGYWLIPDNMHEPLEQGFIITKKGANNALAKRFADYIGTKPARTIMTKYGFVLPNETIGK